MKTKQIEELNNQLIDKTLSLNCTISELREEFEKLKLEAKKQHNDQLQFDVESYIQALEKIRLDNVFIEGLSYMIKTLYD